MSIVRPMRVAMALIILATVAACGGADESSGSGATDATAGTTAASSTLETTSSPLPAGSVINDTVVDNPAFDALESEILTAVDGAGLPGASLLVVHDGAIVEQEAWLDYDVATRVPIASSSKWLAAATIMTVVEEGLLALDEPISTYAPELAGAPAGTITLRQLLSFTSGLRPDTSDPCPEDPDVDLVTCARRLVAKGLRHPPGDEFHYDGVHLLVAGALAELVTGVPFAELFQQRIAEPLEMTQTDYYQVGDPSREVVDHPNPAGGASSTLGDYGRFLEMIVNGGVAPDGTQILTTESIDEMETNQTEGLPVYGSSYRHKRRSPYGLGHWIEWTSPDGATMVSSSPGAFGFRPWVDWSNDVFGVYLVLDLVQRDDPGSVEPDRSSASGDWVISMSADAVGGSLPEEFYGHRG